MGYFTFESLFYLLLTTLDSHLGWNDKLKESFIQKEKKKKKRRKQRKLQFTLHEWRSEFETGIGREGKSLPEQLIKMCPFLCVYMALAWS